MPFLRPGAAPNAAPGLPALVRRRRAEHILDVRAAERRHALPPGLLDALIWSESAYDRLAVSQAGAGGLTQLMPGTADDLGVTDRFDAVANIDGGARYLRTMLRRFGSVELALAAYNAGPGNVIRHGGMPPFRETTAYVRRTLAYWRAIRSAGS